MLDPGEMRKDLNYINFYLLVDMQNLFILDQVLYKLEDILGS